MNIKLLNENAVIPTYATDSAAGMDLYSTGCYTILPGKTEFVHTGICIELPEGCFGAIYPRSGLSSKRGLRLANCVGVVDSDYRGEILVALYNDSDFPQTVDLHDRIAQLVIQPYLRPQKLDPVPNLTQTTRASGGFGHTGK